MGWEADGLKLHRKSIGHCGHQLSITANRDLRIRRPMRGSGGKQAGCRAGCLASLERCREWKRGDGRHRFPSSGDSDVSVRLEEDNGQGVLGRSAGPRKEKKNKLMVR